MKKQSNQKPPFITTIIMLCILFSILSYIWEKFHTIIIIAAILASVLFIGYIISVLEKSRDENLKSPSINSSNTHMSQELKNETIKRQMDILFESTELMNNSNSVGTVINRIKMACNTIDKLNVYTNEELVAAGYKPKEPLSNTKDYIQKNKITIINQAIERNITHELEGLKTTKGKLNKLDKMYFEMKDNKSLNSENLVFLEELHRKTLETLTANQLSAIPSEISNLNMTGYDFEKYCARLLSLNGFTSVSVTKDSGDQGIDIIAFKENVKYGIQCKLYSSRVGNSAVQEAYSGKDFYKCQIGAVLTNNEFTDSAKELADSLGVLLWNGNFLNQLQQHI